MEGFIFLPSSLTVLTLMMSFGNGSLFDYDWFWRDPCSFVSFSFTSAVLIDFACFICS